MFGGNEISIKNMSQEMDQLLKYMIEHKNINNEQIAIGYLCKKKENFFTKFYRINSSNHLSLFQEMV
jgi:hypothetical protein